jgi:3-hydroxyacyl-CoA dehydrogenase/enoyl-CoA hydratase/3-hydroxybutyryl-CoA epimerase/enoyl-CoA isomerase
MYTGEKLSLNAIEDNFIELCFNNVAGSVNKLDQQTLQELSDALDHLSKADNVRGLLLTSEKSAFIVGADITQFKQMFATSKDNFLKTATHINGMMSKIEDLPFPTVAAINGYALGGGLEVCLACDARVMSTDAKIGLPETGLGILPGWGGTVRLPRLSSFTTALEWITSARQFDATSAHVAGVVEMVVEPENLRSQALHLLYKMAGGEIDYFQSRQRKLSPIADNRDDDTEVIADSFRDIVISKTNGCYPAPLKAIELMRETIKFSRDKAVEHEACIFYELSQSSQARALIGLFVGDQYVARKAKGYALALEQKMPEVGMTGVIGAGIMGGGIAFQTATRGLPVVMKDIAQAALDLGMNEANKLLKKAVAKGKMDDAMATQILAMIKPTLDDEPLADCQLVVEAVVEHLPVKQSVLSSVEQQLPSDAIIVSNTSSISINQLAKSLQKPARFCGMHFFNPVHVMQLVEVIRGEHTSDQTIATVCNHALKLGKKPIVVNDCPGFLVNRILFAQCFALELLLRDGVCFQQIDQVMEDWGMPMGPAYLMDVVGLDTIVHCYAVMTEGLPERFVKNGEMPTETLLKTGRQGQKNGLGYYSYQPSAGGKPEKTVDQRSIDLLISIAGSNYEIDAQTIIERLVLPLAMEMVHCLEEGIVSSPTEADMALIWGVGFPPFRGGICRWMDEQGLSTVCAMADKYSYLGKLYKPTESMRNMANAKKTFYS